MSRINFTSFNYESTVLGRTPAEKLFFLSKVGEIERIVGVLDFVECLPYQIEPSGVPIKFQLLNGMKLSLLSLLASPLKCQIEKKSQKGIESIWISTALNPPRQRKTPSLHPVSRHVIAAGEKVYNRVVFNFWSYVGIFENSDRFAIGFQGDGPNITIYFHSQDKHPSWKPKCPNPKQVFLFLPQFLYPNLIQLINEQWMGDGKFLVSLDFSDEDILVMIHFFALTLKIQWRKCTQVTTLKITNRGY